MGWFGTKGQLLHYLRVVGADQDEDGRFLIRGAGVVSFLGIDLGDQTEIVVDNDAEYFIKGQPCSLTSGLAQTSYGLNVHVINVDPPSEGEER